MAVGNVICILGLAMMLMVIILSSLFWYSLREEKESNMQLTTVVPAANSLYTTSEVVTELPSASLVESFLSSGKPSIVVFYAPWCGHCRNFVKPYEAVARASISSRRNVTFAAINCVALGNVCRKMFSVSSFPTLTAFNLSPNSKFEINKKESRGVELPRGIAQVRDFIGKYSEELAHPLNVPMRGDVANEMHEFVDIKLRSEARVASVVTPSLRLHDALESVNHLLLMEVDKPGILSELGRRDAIESLLKTLVVLLPVSKKEEIRMYTEILSLFASTTESESITNQLDPSRTNSVTPASNESHILIRIKALLVEYDELSVKSRAGKIRKEKSMASHWSVCKQPQPQLIATGNQHASRISSNDESGYSCGLWQLFHFFSVAAELRTKTNVKNSNSNNNDLMDVNALSIQVVIHKFIKELFNCEQCRIHFLAVYESCSFGRCSIGSEDFSSMQAWLFLAHDYATRRIMLQQHQIWCQLFHSTEPQTKSHNQTFDIVSSSLSSTSLNHLIDRDALSAAIGTEGCLDGVALEMLVESVMWPGKDCQWCRNGLSSTIPTQNQQIALSLDEKSSSYLWNTTAVLAYLHLSYWDPRWTYDPTIPEESSNAHPENQSLNKMSPTADTFQTSRIWYILLMAIMAFGAVIAVRDSITLVFGPMSSEFTRKRSCSIDDNKEGQLNA